MKLLSTASVRTTKHTLEVEAIDRARKLREEESKACKAFATKKQEIIEKKAEMLEDYKLSMETLSKQRNSLLSEVTSLERRKREAEVPVDLKLKELTSLQEQASLDLTSAEALRAEALAVGDKAEFLLDSLADLKDTLSVKEQDLLEKERKLDREERRLLRSNEDLTSKWLEYHQKIGEMNAEYLKRKFELEALAKANDVYRESLDTMSLDQDRARIAIRDGYASLERAREEILGRKT